MALCCRDGAALPGTATRPASATAGRTSCHGEVCRSAVDPANFGDVASKISFKGFFVTALQEIASLKRQFAELLSDIGFIKEGLRARVIERLGSKGSDGVLEATGPEVTRV